MTTTLEPTVRNSRSSKPRMRTAVELPAVDYPSSRRTQQEHLAPQSDETSRRAEPSFQLRRRSAIAEFFSDFSLEKSLTVIAFCIALTIASICVLDLAIGWPLMRASLAFDWIYLVCAFALFWMCFDVFRDQTRQRSYVSTALQSQRQVPNRTRLPSVGARRSA